MEREGTLAQNMYWIFSGEILIYKRINIELKAKMEEDQQLQKEVYSIAGVNPLELFHNPTSTNKNDIGICLGSMKGGNILVGEDSALFQKKLGYTIVARKGLIAFKYPSKSAQ